MAENSKIEWTTHTQNFWIGCTRVSEGCKFCYAETLMDKRLHVAKWGPGGARYLTGEANRLKPFHWDKKARAAGRIDRVFCSSLSDVFDDHPSIKTEWRAAMWGAIATTQSLEWLLLTKRPENWPVFLPVAERRAPFLNMRLGVTIENQAAADERGPILQFAHDLGWPTFVSYEPAIGPVNWEPLMSGGAIDWLICGGESGQNYRPMKSEWAIAAGASADEYEVPFFMKQLGGHPNKRGHLEDLPEYLRSRAFPRHAQTVPWEE